MKKLIIAIVLALTAATSARAERVITINNGIGGLLLGAGGGAIAGQMIGRNTESTLIGTAVGTMVGYMVGNEMDKNQGQPVPVTYRPAPAPVYPEQRSSYRYRYEPVEHHHPGDECREVEILGTVAGDPERLLTTACWTPQGWVLVDEPDRPAARSSYSGNYRSRSEWGAYRPSPNSYTHRIRYPY
ncbi:MAG: glycine zipper 2TM domain-containing protein [Desulfofustis sp.]|jgi:hypothetical protein|nr:glycine zipper 2TM domain-containing protein [Desulfofustis sp.]